MEMQHFLFHSGCWIGEGKIQLTAIEEKLTFYTRWRTLSANLETLEFEATQEIQIAGHSDIMHNVYDFYHFDGKYFEVELENPAWGKVIGKGTFDEKFIGWEFRSIQEGFEGYEYYLLQEDETYTLKAEFSTKDDFRTTIEGKIWKQMARSTKGTS